MPLKIYSVDPKDRLRRACITWIRLGSCRRCGKRPLIGYLDGKPISRACTECGHTEPIRQIRRTTLSKPRITAIKADESRRR